MPTNTIVARGGAYFKLIIDVLQSHSKPDTNSVSALLNEYRSQAVLPTRRSASIVASAAPSDLGVNAAEELTRTTLYDCDANRRNARVERPQEGSAGMLAARRHREREPPARHRVLLDAQRAPP
jgi:hypothetical protein